MTANDLSMISRIRKENLRMIREILPSRQGDIGELFGYSQPDISLFEGGKKSIPDLLCKKIESELDLPTGWMSRDNKGIRLSAEEYELIVGLRSITPKVNQQIHSLINELRSYK
jgi:hypothetical protein